MPPSLTALVLLFAIIAITGLSLREAKNIDETEYDEMALQHIVKAKAYAFDTLYKVLIIVPLFELFRLIPGCGIRLGGLSVFRFVLGTCEVAKGFKFLQLERDGDFE